MEKFGPSLKEQLNKVPGSKPKFHLKGGVLRTGTRKYRRPRYYHIVMNKAWYKSQVE